MHPNDIGEIAEATIIAKLLQAGYRLLRPIGQNWRYDLIIARENGKFDRVQCKTGRLKNGRIRFYSSSMAGGKTTRHYYGEIDFFGIFCPETGDCYLVPISKGMKHAVCLRIDKPKNNQVTKIRFATEYKI